MTIEVINSRILKEAKINGTSNNNSRPQRPSVCRNLFGTVDHEECMRFLETELQAIAEKDKRKYNFDFQEEKPLEEVNYRWTPVKRNEKVPRPYALDGLPFLSRNSTSNTAESPKKPQVTLKLTQTTLEPYVKSRKRTSVQPAHDEVQKKVKNTS